MEFNQDFDYRIFDSLIDKNIRFAIYRFPGQQEIHLVLQNTHKGDSMKALTDLDGNNGFVIAPFRISQHNPIVLINPDVVLKGEKAIFSYLKDKDFEAVDSNIETKSEPSINTFSQYKAKYNIFLTALKDGEFDKLVLSRTLDYSVTEDFSSGSTFKNACEKYPYNFVFLCNTPETGTWLGISPELLVSEDRGTCQTVALAGTKDISTKDWDEKNKNEQQIVVDYMEQQLTKAGYSYTKAEPFTARSGNIHHLKTEFTFSLEDKNKIGEVLDLLHPSPAVCGFPKEKAFDFISENEGYDRHYYSGFIGTLNIEDKSDLYVNLRCMQIGKNTLRMYAGGGLLPTSDIMAEWKETENKLQTILAVVE